MKRLTGWGISRILLISGLLISFNYLGAQEQTKDELARQAVNLFDAAKYKKAATAFEKLLQVYPNELSYNYYLGVSYLLTNENPDTCILLLKQAASKNFRPEVHFYLAEAYYYNYQFDEAEISLLNFRNLASRKCSERAKCQRTSIGHSSCP
jgi:predicted Zn-dependent protease